MKKTSFKAIQETSHPRFWTTQPRSQEGEAYIGHNNYETEKNSYNFYLLKIQRYLRRDSVLRLFQEPRRELPITLLNL